MSLIIQQYYNAKKQPLSVLCVCFPENYGGWGGGNGPGGLEGQVYGPRGTAHEVQNANHQDPRTDC